MAPVAGAFHRGFLQRPAACTPVLDLHGTRDWTVPANGSEWGDEPADCSPAGPTNGVCRGAGWRYEDVHAALGGFAESSGQALSARKFAPSPS